jgi:class 3 adenylate cyclase/tetratricopeptide (TPR) repeat protein
LSVRCRSCARELVATIRFCDGCGTPVAAGGPSGAVRKTVTAMFCDLGGSTGFSERVDAESSRSVIGRYHAMLQEEVDAHGGTVAKFIGDGMLAFFGIPEVAEDDADRAVAAAAAMQRRFGAFAAEVSERHDEALTFRIGVNSGELVIGDGDADVVGDALNVAARLEKACAPGRVLVGEPTWRLTRGAYGFEPLGEVTVAGRAEPVSAHVLLDDGGGRTEEATPFVGRDRELARLRAALDEAVDRRTARFVTVIGPPGVGKTRLSRELEQSVVGEATILHTACERSGAATFAPVVDLIRPTVGLVDGADDEATRVKLAEIVPPEEPERERIVDGLAGIVGVGEVRSTEEAFWSVRRLVESLASTQPLVLVIDDIQWAEALLLDLLEHLAEWVADAPVLIVGLARPELRDLRPALAEQGRRVADVIVLDGLDAEATAQLADRMLGGDGLPAELLARLPASTDGNPLFVRELVRMLVDEEIIRRDGDTWRLTVDVEAVEVPPTIRSLLAARIERLPVAERTVLERASVIGADFTLGGLRALVEVPDSVEGHLERLRRRDLVEPTGAYWGDDPQYRFHHVLIRDAVYGRLLKETRAELHQRIGEWTEAAASRVVGEHGPAVAHHYELAHDYLGQLGALDDHGRGLGRRAADLLTIASRRALARDDLVAAESLATRALACLPAGDGEARADLLLLACEAVLASGDLAPAAALVDQLSLLGADDDRLDAWADTFRAQLIDLTDSERLDEAEALAVGAIERFTSTGDASGRAKAHLVRAGLLARRGQVADSEAELDRALGAAREAGDQRRLVAVLGVAPAAALWGPSPVVRAGGRCLDVIRLLRITAASPAVEATSTRHQAVLEALRGRLGTARSLLGESRSTVEELGLRRDLMEVELFTGLVALLDHAPDVAEGHLRTAHEGLTEMGVDSDATTAAAYLARALLTLGRLDEAEALAAGASAGQGLKAGIAWRALRSRLLAAGGDTDAAVRLAEEAVAIAAGTDLLLDHADAWAALADVRRAAGDESAASDAQAEADRLYGLKGSTIHSTSEHAADLEVQPTGAGEGTEGGPGENMAVRQSRQLIEHHRAGEVASENLAAGWGRAFASRWMADGADAMRAHMVEDLAFDDRRAGLGLTLVGADAMIDSLGAIDLVRGDDRFEVFDVVAHRGDLLVLFDQGTRGAFEVRMLTVVEFTPDGRQRRLVTFDSDDLADALALLDEWFAEGEGAPFAEEIDVGRRFGRAIAEGDADGLLNAMAEDFASFDHRPLGWGARDAATFVAAVAARSDTLGRGVMVTPAFLRVERGAVLSSFEIRTRSADGTEGLELGIVLLLTRDGQLVRSETFAEDAGADADDRFDALLA